MNNIQARSKTLDEYLATTKRDLEDRLSTQYPASRELDSLEATYAAMHYMVFLGGGGKRLRPALSMLACTACGGLESSAWPYAQGVEEIHTYTLILDDIQDRSTVRRHKDSCHVRFGVDTALLGAMRLYERGIAPFHLLKEPDAEEVRRLLDLLHRGQAADLAAEQWPPEKCTVTALQFIHSGKTSALIQLALLGGAVAANAKRKSKEALIEYGYYLGLAFQAQDDILSAVSTDEALGKPAGTGSDDRKLTYPRVFGSVADAVSEAGRLAENACACLAASDLDDTTLLRDLALFAVKREQ